MEQWTTLYRENPIDGWIIIDQTEANPKPSKVV
jgi:hypothetical protein